MLNDQLKDLWRDNLNELLEGGLDTLTEDDRIRLEAALGRYTAAMVAKLTGGLTHPQIMLEVRSAKTVLLSLISIELSELMESRSLKAEQVLRQSLAFAWNALNPLPFG